MAKTATKPAPAAKKNNLPAKPEYKYGVPYLAEKLGNAEASVRVALRKHGVEKAEGGIYGWNSQKDADAVVAQLKTAKPAAEKPKPKVKAAGTEKPVPKKKAA